MSKKEQKTLPAALDLDGNLIDTLGVMHRQKTKYVTTTAQALGLENSVVNTSFNIYDNEAYARVVVDPRRWEFVARQLGKEFGNKRVFMENLGIMWATYDIVPDVFPGLDELFECFAPIVVVTHGQRRWSLNKLEWTGLIDKVDDMVTVSPRRYKDKKDWEKGFKKLGSPTRWVGMGDSIIPDVKPLYELGARTIHHDRGHGWSVQNGWQKPEDVFTVNDLFQAREVVQSILRGQL